MQRSWTVTDIAEEAAAFDWSKVDALSDEEIMKRAEADPDGALPTSAELDGFARPAPQARNRRSPTEAAE